MARFSCRFRPILITLLLTAFAVPWFTPEALAAPYIGRVTYTYSQPDGSSFPVKLYGDEFFAYQRTLDGREVILDPKTGYWCYARLDASGQAFESLGIPVVTAKSGSQAANRASALGAGAAAPNQSLPVDVVLERVRKAQGKFLVDDRGRPMAPTAAMAAGGMKALDGPAPSPPSRTTLGDFVGLCILVDFSDAPGTITQTQVDNFCNQPSGYVEFGNACSINEYYKIQSNGKFNFNNTVTAYVRMPQPKTYYDDNSEQDWGTAKAQELVSTALDLLVADGFDFTTLSRDGSGYIYSINVFYAGTCASGWGLGLWPHSWAIPTKVVDAANGIRAYRYQMTDMKTSLSIGTFCHENGHMTCLYPDLYSYVNGSSIVAYFSLMASGNHAGGGKHPTNIDPYLKYKSGWADIVEVNSSTHVRATAQVDRNYYHKFTNPSDNREYFLIENRNNTGYEGPYGGHLSSVAPGRGLVVWQVWEAGSNTHSSIQQSSTYTTPYEAFIIEAAPTSSYTPWYSAPSPSTGSADTFYAGYGADPLNDATSPDLHFWDHTGATGRTVNSGMTIHTYGAQGASLSYTIGTGTPPATPAIGMTTTALAPACDLGTDAPSAVFNVYNAGGGTLNYSISDNAAWLSCLPTSGSVTTGWAAITVTYATAALAPGQHTATITVTAPGASNTPQTIPVTLTVAPAPVLSVAPATISYELWPGDTDGSQYFSISNAGGGTMQYTVTDSAAWLTPAVASGNCTNETDLVYVSVDTAGLNAGVHTENVTVTAPLATGSPQQVAVSLTIHGGLQVLTPNGGEVWAVNGARTISWATNVATDVRVELYKNGALSRTIVAPTANDGLYEWTLPSDLEAGSDYRIRVTTTDDAYTDDSNADFTIVSPIYSADMTNDPGWTLEGQWAYGSPTGGGGEYGEPDPTAGYTGPSVVGYNLAGDYAHSLATTFWATTPAIDCSNYNDVSLSFYRWLGVESGNYDHAYVEVSSDGAIWQPVWSNSTTSMDGGAWEYVEYDLSAWADGQAAVQIRWGMGTTDASWAYCGWNIDDVMVLGAYVAPATHTVTFQTDGASGASITGTNPQTVTHAGDCTAVTAVAPANWHFVQWSLAGTPYSAANPLTVTNVTADMTLTAEFAIDTFTLTYAAGPNGAITGDSPQVVAHGGSGTPVTATPNANHHFVNWSDGSTANPRTDTNVTVNINATANFAIDTHTVTFQTDGTPGASLTGTTPQTVNHGSNATPVTAVPPANWEFLRWTVGGVPYSTANPMTATNVTADMTIVAEFALDTYTLTYTAGPNGTITGDSPQVVAHGGNGTPVWASADLGYHFVAWSDAVTANPRTDANVTVGIAVTASFDIDPAPNAPVVAGPVLPTNDARPTWTWTSGGGGAGVFRYGWSEGDWLGEGLATSFRPDFGLAEGDHTLYVQERHEAMLWSESGRHTVSIDLTPPLLTVASALPPQATEGRAVVISVAANETLTDAPDVTVNGHPAAYTGTKDGAAYTYTYLVQGPATDPPGWANIEVAAFDLAGNSGSVTSADTLQILPAQQNLPAAGSSMMALLALALAACATAALRRPEPVRQVEGHQHGSRAQREKGPGRQ